MRSDGGPDLDLLVRLLSEAASALPAVAVAGETESQSDETAFIAVTGGISAEEVASRLTESRFAELAWPVPLSESIFRGGAGIPLLTDEEVNAFLADVDERDPGSTSSWLELDQWKTTPDPGLLTLKVRLHLSTSTYFCL